MSMQSGLGVDSSKGWQGGIEIEFRVLVVE